MRWTATLLLLLGACGTAPVVRVEDVDGPVRAHFRRIEGIGSERASTATLAALRERSWQGLSPAQAAQRFESDAGRDSLDWLYASEMRLFAGGRENHFLGARDAWRWLAATNGGEGHPAESRRLAYRLYNHNVAGYAAEVDWTRGTDTAAGTTVALARRGVAKEGFAALEPTYAVTAEADAGPVVTSGAGGPLLALFPRTAARDKRWPYVGWELYAAPVAAVLDFQGGRATLTLLDPAEGEETALFGRTVALKLDFSAAWRRSTDAQPGRTTSRTDVTDASLFLLAPPDSRRRPVLFVHGLDSDPATFRNLALRLLADPEIRANYQFVGYRYGTDHTLLLNSVVFRERWAAFDEHLGKVAPEARRAGTVAIGHSMGGLLLKPLAQASGPRIWNRVFRQPPGRVELDAEDLRVMEAALIFEPRPEIRRLAFLAVPHRGSDLAKGILGQIGSARAVTDPRVAALRERLRTRYRAQLRPPILPTLEGDRTSVDSLRPDDPFLNLLLELPIAVPFHSVIADVDGDRDSPTGDGVVPYASAHLDGAASESILRWGHNVTADPACADEVRRILLLHLQK